MFRCLGRFMTDVAVNKDQDNGTRFDFLIDVTSRRQTPQKFSTVKRLLAHPRHPIKSRLWTKRVLTRLTRAEFDDLINAWWGISGLSSELEGASGTSHCTNYVKYAAYSYAFERLSDAIERG